MNGRRLIKSAINEIHKGEAKKINFVWMEANGCMGNIISFLNADKPDVPYFLKEMVNLKFSPSLMQAEGEVAYEEFLEVLNTDFILGVEGALTNMDEGFYNIFATYKGRRVPTSEAINLASKKAKAIIAIGTCASFGGISAAKPNPTGCISLEGFLQKEVINIPGCPANPLWVMGTIASIILHKKIEVDEKGRPIMFFKESNHTNCPRRSYFDNKVYAEKLGEKECMIKVGCKGPITKAYCPLGLWNSRINWPVEANTPCIGCASEFFPDGTEPFVKY
ncbi:hydrogenase small subunit [Clostridium algoriphilum]|uniref:hydrogenase small subunit n=1 Tax=Clostridium algoriphilum TaxID=198347 RepID=UPI001CF3F8FA|nr:hydrogenase small subunit [Clostridium algoriphilum]MCB2293308.1 hydrogenase small subunit [Clostridium algoriphilum]